MVLITFRSISALALLSSGEIQKSKTVDPRWPPFGSHDIITTYCNVTLSVRIVDPKADIIGCTIYPPSVNVIAFILAQYGGVGADQLSLSPSPRKQQMSGLGGVKFVGRRFNCLLSKTKTMTRC